MSPTTTRPLLARLPGDTRGLAAAWASAPRAMLRAVPGRAKPARMPRYALRIEYDGAPVLGLAAPGRPPSVQGAVEAALARLEPDVPTIAAAGRTDAGVHARGQVAHADLAATGSRSGCRRR